jgi:thiamine monophosphate synthase
LAGEACNILASILHANSKNEEAYKYGLRALQIREKHLGKDNMEIVGTLDLLLEIVYSLGKEEAALPLMKRLEALAAKANNKAAP